MEERSANAAANIHGVETARIIAADQPPLYDLDQIEDEVTDTIRRTKRMHRIQVALLGASGPAGEQL